MPEAESSISRNRQIAITWEKFVTANRFEEALWLAAMQESHEMCGTSFGRERLRRTSALARDVGSAVVADYIDEFLDEGD